MSPRRKPRVLITAGPTREYIDSVRYLSNDSSGKMGFALATAAQRRGWQVTLVHGPVALPKPTGVRTVALISAAQMLDTCQQLWPKHDALIMAAAVADYTPAQPYHTKRKKTAEDITLKLRPTVDILATLAANRRDDQVVIGFALEDMSPRRNAERKLHHKKLDAIVLNHPAAIGAKRSRLEVLQRGRPWQILPETTKARQAL
ncbi:MAG: phosphopantothenoylcysteine decarboxylase, partial [Planctomycetota bacterium]